MTDPNDPAYPPTYETMGKGDYINALGLTKREYFAAMAMQGMIASETETLRFAMREKLASESVAMADALIAELSKEIP